MSKILSIFAIVTLTINAFASPSVKKLGAKPAVVSAESTAVAPVPARSAAKNTAIPMAAKVTKASLNKNAAKAESARFPSFTKKIIEPTTPGGTSSGGTSSGGNTGQTMSTAALTEKLNNTVQRVENLESRNVVTDVNTTTSGNYVTNVVMDGNKLNVTKSNLLLAPVRNSAGQNVSGDAEIWIIK